MSEAVEEKKVTKATTKKKVLSTWAEPSGAPLFLSRGIKQANDIVARAWC